MKPLVKLIKHAKRKDREVPAVSESESRPNKWSAAVRSWVSEFQEERREESLPSFDSLFSDPSGLGSS